MSKRLLRVTIESIELAANGDVPGQKIPSGDKRNAVIASLDYPRSGAPSVTSAQQYNLPEKIAFSPDQNDFFACGLFKEEVQDETILQIKITDTDRSGKIEQFVLALVSELAGAVLEAATEGLTTFLGAVAAVGIDQVRSGFGKAQTGDQVFVIGATDKIRLNVDSLPADPAYPLRLNLSLAVPEEVRKAYFEMDSAGRPVEKEIVLPKGAQNGHIVIRLSAAPCG